MTSPFDIIKHINMKSELEFDIEDYSPWLINRAYSNTLETLFYAEVMNRRPILGKDQQYRFYYLALPAKKRFGEWNKPAAINTNIELIMKAYQVNRVVAESYLKLMNDSAIDILKEKMSEGGNKCLKISE